MNKLISSKQANIYVDYLKYLHALLPQVDLPGQLLPGRHVRVVRLREQRLQLLQLRVREDGPVPPLALRLHVVQAELRGRVAHEGGQHREALRRHLRLQRHLRVHLGEHGCGKFDWFRIKLCFMKSW